MIRNLLLFPTTHSPMSIRLSFHSNRSADRDLGTFRINSFVTIFFSGTDITLLGEDLDAGYFFNVSIGSVPCTVRQRSSSMVVCRTGPSMTEGADFLIVNADGTQIKVDSVQYQYAYVF